MAGAAPLPSDEVQRLRTLRDYGALDTPPERDFDDLTFLAAHVCQTPIALVSLVDGKRQWFKSCLGLEGLDQTSRNVAFCSHAILSRELTVVGDTMLDPRFADNPLVTGDQQIRFYAGAPLVTPEGHVLGTICVLDRVPRTLTVPQQEALRALSRQVVAQLDQRRLLRRVAHDATHDVLTGLPNRALFAYRVGRCVVRAARDPNYRFAVMFLDLDRFKLVNDSLGHAAGDELLATVAERLSRQLRGGDVVARAAHAETASAAADSADDLTAHPAPADDGFVARLGGDEFTVLLDDLESEADASRIAARLLEEVNRPLTCAGQEITPAVSIGVAIGSAERYGDARAILRDADAALYKAKQSGRGRFVIFDHTMHEAAVARLRLESDLRRAIERGDMRLSYQPIISLADREVIAFEALVRWKLGDVTIPPGAFIPVAEETGLILPIGRWVIDEACRQLAAWRAARPAAFEGITVSVNLSRKQLADPDLLGVLRASLARHNIPAASLCLEVTETMVMAEPEQAKAVLVRIRELGIKLQMDDFGTGHSSLSCLNSMPLDGLKLDRSFCAGLGAKPLREAAAVVQAVVQLAHNIGMTVVAEGLETDEQVALLQALDCDSGQGFIFAYPLPADEAAKLLKDPAADSLRAA
jgi:predicted signal transduction protein with EAL and GGDEF domain